MKELIKVDNINGELLTTSRNVAEVFEKEHKEVLRKIEGMKCSKEFRERNFTPTSYTNGQNKIHPMFLITRDGFAMLGMGYTGEKAMKFKEDYISAFNKMESAISKMEYVSLTDPNLASLKFIADDLRVNEASRTLMYEKCLIELGHNAAVKALPDYSEEKVTKSLSDLLKDHGVNLSAQRANKILIDFGILEEKERKASKGKIKKYKSLTEVGLKFGKNLMNRNNQKETQAHYFVDGFSELIDLCFSRL